MSGDAPSVNCPICRQVLDCGDGVREVTALVVAALKIPRRAPDTATSTQSGDSEDSVAAVQRRCRANSLHTRITVQSP
jgi:hypothetical protein